MTFAGDILAFFTYTAMIMALYGKADQCARPTGLTYEWLDKFVVNVSWKPMCPSYNSDMSFLIRSVETNVRNMKKTEACVAWRNYTDSFLTEERGSDQRTYKISMVKDCNHSNESNSAHITIHTLKPRAEVMKDFKCLIMSNTTLNCSWIPLNRSHNLMLSHRTCGKTQEEIKGLKKCDQPYSNGERNGCFLHIDTKPDNICILVETDTVMNTLKPVLAVPPPELNVTEDGDSLKLSWTPPVFGTGQCWIYEIRYKRCDNPMEYRNISNGETTMMVHYDKNCRYEFQSRVMSATACSMVSSDLSVVVTHGTNKTDRTMTVVAIVIPIILSLSVILSCYCFRRHSAIICPTIPDPSAIFKEIMNGNKELKPPTGSLYTPVPEPIEPCKITLISENTVLQHNS